MHEHAQDGSTALLVAAVAGHKQCVNVRVPFIARRMRTLALFYHIVYTPTHISCILSRGSHGYSLSHSMRLIDNPHRNAHSRCPMQVLMEAGAKRSDSKQASALEPIKMSPRTVGIQTGFRFKVVCECIYLLQEDSGKA